MEMVKQKGRSLGAPQHAPRGVTEPVDSECVLSGPRPQGTHLPHLSLAGTPGPST